MAKAKAAAARPTSAPTSKLMAKPLAPVSSRLCVKVGRMLNRPTNARALRQQIPKHATDDSVRKHFATLGGTITDCRVLKTPKGVPRRMAFIGFSSTADAEAAQKHFDKTFMDTSKMQVDFALPLGNAALEERKQLVRMKKHPGSAPTKTAAKHPLQPKSEKHREFMQLMQPNKLSLQAEQFWQQAEAAGDDSSADEADEADEANDVAGDINQPASEAGAQGSATTNRLFVRNLAYSITKEGLEAVFASYAPTAVALPLDEAQRPKGFAIVTFADFAQAARARKALDGTAHLGRLMHIVPGEPERAVGGEAAGKKRASFKDAREEQRRKRVHTGADEKAWAALFVRGDAAAGAMAQSLGVGKSELILGGAAGDDNVAVRVAMSEARVVADSKTFLAEHGIDLTALEAAVRGEPVAKSDAVMLVKNLPANADEAELRSLFTRFGTVDAFVMPPSRTMALVSFADPAAAKAALRDLAYSRYKNVPLYLQWAPEHVLKPGATGAGGGGGALIDADATEEENELRVAASAGRVAFIKNLDFAVSEPVLAKHILATVGARAESVSIPTHAGKAGEALSGGFGFAQFASEAATRAAIKALRGSVLLGRVLDVRMSERPTGQAAAPAAATPGTKLVVRNLAFETTKKEVRQLFAAFGQVKSVRLPKKMDGSLRGFAFVDFATHAEAKTAFASLAAAHLYGRHLVIQWAEDTAEDKLFA